jgi:hypothetical protein
MADSTNIGSLVKQQAEIMFAVEVIDIVPKRADDVVILSREAGNDADGLRLSRKRTNYMLKMGAKVTNQSFGRKDANFRGFY